MTPPTENRKIAQDVIVNCIDPTSNPVKMIDCIEQALSEAENRGREEIKDYAWDLFERCAWYRHRLDQFSNSPKKEELREEFERQFSLLPKKGK